MSSLVAWKEEALVYRKPLCLNMDGLNILQMTKECFIGKMINKKIKKKRKKGHLSIGVIFFGSNILSLESNSLY